MLVTLEEIGEAARQVALGLASPKKRAAIVPLPEVVDMSVVSLAELEWFKQLPKGKRDEYRAAVEPLGRRIADAYGEVAAADRRCSDLAAEVSGPVVGEDASWRWCAATSVVSYSSQGYGARRYAMASAALRWQDMVELGYRAGAIMRRAKVPALPKTPWFLRLATDLRLATLCFLDSQWLGFSPLTLYILRCRRASSVKFT